MAAEAKTGLADKNILKKMQLGVADMKNCITFGVSKHCGRVATPDITGFFYSPQQYNSVLTLRIDRNSPSKPSCSALTAGSRALLFYCPTSQKLQDMTNEIKRALLECYYSTSDVLLEQNKYSNDLQHTIAIRETARRFNMFPEYVEAVINQIIDHNQIYEDVVYS